MNPNTTLLQAKNSGTPDLTPAPLAGSSSGVEFAFQGLQPPSNLYVNVDDQLIISAASSVGPEIVTVNARLQLPTGRIEDMQFVLAPASTRTVLKKSYPLAEGFLLSLSASAVVALTRGQTFVRVSLQRSASGVGQPACCLMADYVTTQSAPGYPNGRILSPTEGPGYVYTVAGNIPSAGSDFGLPVPVNARWRVRSVQATLVTAVAAANRQVSFMVISAAGVSTKGGALTAQVASLTVSYTGMGIGPFVAANTGLQVIPMPPDLVVCGSALISHQIQSATLNLQGADQWSGAIALVEEWLDNV